MVLLLEKSSDKAVSHVPGKIIPKLAKQRSGASGAGVEADLRKL